MNEPRRTAWYVAVAWLALCTLGPFLVFTLSDTRLPNDHDDYYTWQIVDALDGAVRDPGPSQVRGAMDRAWHSGQPRPQGIEMVHAAILALFGPSLLVYRLVNLPFLLLLVGATWAAGRMVLGRWGGLLAAFVVATLPIILNHSRKVETQFHSTALGMLALVLCLWVLFRPQRNLRGWLLLGLVQGVRCYTHPIAMTDIVGSFAALLLALALALGLKRRTLRTWVPAWAAAAVLGLVVGARFLFGNLMPYGAPSLKEYMDSSNEWLVPHDAAGMIASLWECLSTATWTMVDSHLFPPIVLLLFVPGLLFVPVALKRIWRSQGWASAQGRTLLFLVLLLAIQGPVVIQTLWSGAYALDWMGLLPTMVLLTLLALQIVFADGSRIRAQSFAAALVLLGTVTAWLPLAVSIGGPDPLEDYDPYDGPILRKFSQGEKWTRAYVRHLVSQSPQPTEALVPRMRAAAPTEPAGSPPGKALLGSWDLIQKPTDASRSCVDSLGRAEAGCCDWTWRPGGYWAYKNEWPFLFGGFAGLVEWEDVRVDEARFHIVRLSFEAPVEREGHDRRTWLHEVVTDSCLAQAVTMTEEKFGPSADIVQVSDPAHQFGDILHKPIENYSGLTLTVDRTVGRVVGLPPRLEHKAWR